MSSPNENPSRTPFRPVPPLVIGLLGGVASGKSTVARIFGEHGLEVVDADAEARRAVADPEVLAALRARFGDGIFDAAGALDRAALARQVFSEPAARRDLEAITHPPIRAALLAQIEKALAEGTSCVLDVPLLIENGLIERCDLCVFVDTNDEARRARAAARGWEDGEIARREANQASMNVKKNHCRYTIENDGSLARTVQQVADLLRGLAVGF